MAQNKIDGQRKAVIVPAGRGMVRFVGLLRESEWRKVRKDTLFTTRELLSATLHDENLGGQLPEVGYEFPAALLHGKGRNGTAMAEYLSTIAAQSKAERGALRVLKAIRNAIL